MSNWQERLKEEYTQFKEKYEKLKSYNNEIEVKRNLELFTETVEEDYRFRLMREQQSVMGNYLHLLELRAKLENIEL